MEVTNLLMAEPLIKARLVEKVPGFSAVYSAIDLDDVMKNGPKTPSAHVLLGPMGVTQEQGDGTRAELEQTWIVAVMVRNARNVKTGEEIREEAGVLLLQALRALMGWRPTEGARRLKPAGGFEPIFSPGYGLFPLAFTMRIATKAIED